MTWTSAESMIDSLLRSAHPGVKDSLENAWSQYKYRDYADIVTCKDGELLLKVRTSAYLQVLNMKREEIKNFLNKRNNRKIRNIKFCLGG